MDLNRASGLRKELSSGSTYCAERTETSGLSR